METWSVDLQVTLWSPFFYLLESPQVKQTILGSLLLDKLSLLPTITLEQFQEIKQLLTSLYVSIYLLQSVETVKLTPQQPQLLQAPLI